MKNLLCLLVVVTGCAFMPLQVSAQQECHVPFTDEGTTDDSFVAFRKRLKNIIARKDSEGLLSLLDPQITVSYGGDMGKRDFVKFWELRSKRTRLWEELGTVVENGGYMITGEPLKTFTAPYTFDGFPGACPTELDAFTHQTIFGRDVALRRQPSLSGEVITRLSYNVVTLVGDKTVTVETGEHSVPEWYFVKTLGGLEGYVNARYVRSPFDYRALFQKKKGRWLIVAFVAGD
jgi:hypothetical protein